MPETAPKGYIARESEFGLIAIEEAYPGYGLTTITWQPAADLDGAKPGTIEVPSELLHAIVRGYGDYLKAAGLTTHSIGGSASAKNTPPAEV